VLAYLASKEQFLKDAPTIEDIVASEVKKNLSISVGNSEYQSWRNSLGNAMSHVMLDPSIPDDAAFRVGAVNNLDRFFIAVVELLCRC